jgi:hypothetical protein
MKNLPIPRPKPTEKAAKKSTTTKKSVAKKKDYRSNDLVPLKKKLGTAKISGPKRKAYLNKGDETMRENVGKRAGGSKTSIQEVKKAAYKVKKTGNKPNNLPGVVLGYVRSSRLSQRGK